MLWLTLPLVKIYIVLRQAFPESVSRWTARPKVCQLSLERRSIRHFGRIVGLETHLRWLVHAFAIPGSPWVERNFSEPIGADISSVLNQESNSPQNIVFSTRVERVGNPVEEGSIVRLFREVNKKTLVGCDSQRRSSRRESVQTTSLSSSTMSEH